MEIEYTLIGGDICSYCKLLSGWICKEYQTARRLRFKGKESTPNQFLKVSTATVCERMKGMSPAEIEALKPLYEPKKSSITETPKKKETDRKSPLTKSISSTKKEQTPLRKKITSIVLPTITQLLEQEKGLMGVLQDDIFQVFNDHFGSNQTIACKILLCLGSG